MEQLPSIDKESLSKPKTKINESSTLPLLVNFNKILSNVKEVVKKHWTLFNVKPCLQKNFTKRLILTYRINTNPLWLLGSANIINNEETERPVKRKQKCTLTRVTPNQTIFGVSKFWEQILFICLNNCLYFHHRSNS